MLELKDLRGLFRLLGSLILYAFLFIERAHYLLEEKFFLSQVSFG